MFFIFSNILPIQYPASRGHCGVNAIKFLNILPFTNYRSKHTVDKWHINISFSVETRHANYPQRPQIGHGPIVRRTIISVRVMVKAVDRQVHHPLMA